MDEAFSFWFPIILIEQLTFTDQKIQVEQFGEGHILHSGVLMCRESREKLLNQVGTKKFKVVRHRPANARLCKTCQEKYRANGDSAIHAWVTGKPKKPSVSLPPLAKF